MVTSLGSLPGRGRQQLGARSATGAVAARGRQHAGAARAGIRPHEDKHAPPTGKAGERASAASATSAAKRRIRGSVIAFEYATPPGAGQDPPRHRPARARKKASTTPAAGLPAMAYESSAGPALPCSQIQMVTPASSGTSRQAAVKARKQRACASGSGSSRLS